MDKKIVLPALAAFMILVMVATAFPMATAVVRGSQTNVFNLPLTIVTIAEDDEVRNKGIMVLCVLPWGYMAGQGGPDDKVTLDDDEMDNMRAFDEDTCAPGPTFPTQYSPRLPSWWIDKWADYKIIVLLPNGAKFFWPVSQPFPDGLVLACEVIEKDTVEPKIPQASWEVMKKMVVDVSADFVCKFRWKSIGGFYWSVGVLDLYYTGPQNSEHVAPYIIDIQASYTDPVSRVVYYGAEMQDLCILAWPFDDDFDTDWQKAPFKLLKPEGRGVIRVPDPLDGFVSCEDATLFQRMLLDDLIPTAPQN